MSDLQNHLFCLLEDLTNPELIGQEKQDAIDKAQAGAMIGKVLVDSAKAEVIFLNRQERMTKIANKGYDLPEGHDTIPAIFKGLGDGK
jgi:hypothetical protein